MDNDFGGISPSSSEVIQLEVTSMSVVDFGDELVAPHQAVSW